jgi:hypothetical protein
LVTAFAAKHGHRNPNSTDVHSIYNIKNLAGYLAKYCSKGKPTPESLIAQAPWSKPAHYAKKRKGKEKFIRLMTLDEQRIAGKVWDCSNNLKVKGNCEMLLEGTAEQIWNDSIQRRPDDVKHTEKCSMIFHTPAQLHKLLFGQPLENYNHWLEGFRYQDPKTKMQNDE